MSEFLTGEAFVQRYRAWRGELKAGFQNTISNIPLTLEEACADGSWLFAAAPQPWMANPGGVMHGGIICTLMDTALGSIVGCCTAGMTPTVSLDVQFARPVFLDRPVTIRVHAASIGHTLAYMTGELWQEDEKKPCATASGTYFVTKK